MSSIPTIRSKNPRRRPVQKSSSGCKRCRLRKIKCDERRPFCTQCRNKCFDCPGYPSRPVLRWSTKHEVFDAQELNHNPSKSIDLARADGHVRSPECLYKRKDKDNGSKSTIPGHSTICVESDIPNITHNIDTSEEIPPNDEALPINFQNTLPFTDLWSSELFDVNPEPAAFEGSLYEDEDTPSYTSPSSSFSTDSPDDATVGSQPVEENIASNILDMAEESIDDQGVSNPGPSSPNASCESFAMPLVPIDRQSSQASSFALCPEPCGTSIELVSFYFNVVCHILSTFDSEQNVFRAYVSKKWQSSAILFHTIQSMAAAKLVWYMPEMKAQALESRSLALEHLQQQVSAAQCWNTELLFTVLLLGISSSWFDIADLGIPHLEAVQQAILNGKVESCSDFDAIGFFRNALIYWEMVSCAVSNTVTYFDYESIGLEPPVELKNSSKSPGFQVRPISARIVPHPWTGVASEPQAIFTLISRQINKLRSFGSVSKTADPGLDKPDEFLKILRHLDQAIWAYELPKLHDISNIGDPDTPAIHHLLLAEAYMYANIYQLYGVFSNIRRKRVKWLKETTDSPRRQFNQATWAGTQVSSWTAILQQEDGTEKWLRFLGRSVIIRLEQIQINSGTSCVQALLLLVAATSLSFNSEEIVEADAGSDGEQRQKLAVELDREREDIRKSRNFVLDRLEMLSISNLSAPIRYVKSIVLEIFKRLDVGADLFWMDVLYSMGLLTIIG